MGSQAHHPFVGFGMVQSYSVDMISVSGIQRSAEVYSISSLSPFVVRIALLVLVVWLLLILPLPHYQIPSRYLQIHYRTIMIKRKDGGTNEPDNLIMLCRKHHRELHRLGITEVPQRLLLITKKEQLILELAKLTDTVIRL